MMSIRYARHAVWLVALLGGVLTVGPTQAGSTVRLKDGTTYEDVERTKTDGAYLWLYLDYGSEKIDMRELSAADKARFGFDEAKAAAVRQGTEGRAAQVAEQKRQQAAAAAKAETVGDDAFAAAAAEDAAEKAATAPEPPPVVEQVADSTPRFVDGPPPVKVAPAPATTAPATPAKPAPSTQPISPFRIGGGGPAAPTDPVTEQIQLKEGRIAFFKTMEEQAKKRGDRESAKDKRERIEALEAELKVLYKIRDSGKTP